ncbi:MAG: hypothetical protein DRO98_05060 [Archaeoglobales archaeon]|nr:MAG: hypothetical protein DRO98_05060 [Archaeoglobales archaeon]
MRMCLHENSPEKDWLPVNNGVLRLHPYCIKCGVVKNVSSDKGKKIGYFINSLSRLREFLESRGYKVSQAQIRLIIKELESEGLQDTYALSFSHQKEAFVEIAKKYIRVSEDVIRNFV